VEKTREEHKGQQWQPVTKSVVKKGAGIPLVKAAGCAGCWAAKSISLTSACWECEISLVACAI